MVVQKMIKKEINDCKNYSYFGRKFINTLMGCIFALVGLVLAKILDIDIAYFKIYLWTVSSLIIGYGFQNAGISISSFFKNNKKQGG